MLHPVVQGRVLEFALLLADLSSRHNTTANFLGQILELPCQITVIKIISPITKFTLFPIKERTLR